MSIKLDNLEQTIKLLNNKATTDKDNKIITLEKDLKACNSKTVEVKVGEKDKKDEKTNAKDTQETKETNCKAYIS